MESNEPIAPRPANERTFAILSMVLGIINLCSWLLPICGLPLSIAGLVLGYLGLKSPEHKKLAIAGILLSGVGFLMATVNVIAGILFTPEIERMMEELLGGF